MVNPNFKFIAIIKYALIIYLLIFLDMNQDSNAKITMTAWRLQVNEKEIVLPNPWSQLDFMHNIYAA